MRPVHFSLAVFCLTFFFFAERALNRPWFHHTWLDHLIDQVTVAPALILGLYHLYRLWRPEVVETKK